MAVDTIIFQESPERTIAKLDFCMNKKSCWTVTKVVSSIEIVLATFLALFLTIEIFLLYFHYQENNKCTEKNMHYLFQHILSGSLIQSSTMSHQPLSISLEWANNHFKNSGTTELQKLFADVAWSFSQCSSNRQNKSNSLSRNFYRIQHHVLVVLQITMMFFSP